MSLLRQLTITIVALFLLMFVGTFAISVNNTRNFLRTQLESHAADGANSLALSLTTHMLNNDLAAVETTVNAFFDRGFYREVVVTSVDGRKVFDKQEPVRVHVPAWFVSLIPLQTPPAEALISSGWQQAGKVKVSSNPVFAYDQLWSNTIDSFRWFLGSAVGTFLLGLGALHLMLRPLRAVEDQAVAICNREFPVQEKLPWTRELRSVVAAMNRMAIKVKEMFEEQARAIENMRAQAYVDPVTGLANRRYFNAQLGHLLETPDKFGAGALILLELKDFKQYNDQRGYKAGDELLRQAGALLSAVITGKEGFCAHISGADLAAVVPNVDPHEASRLGEQLARSLNQLHAKGLVDKEEVGHVGVAMYRGQKTVPEFLAEVDLALRAAQAKGANAWHLHDSQALAQTEIRPASYWEEFLRKVIDTRGITLYFQPVRACAKADQRMLHYETLLRITGENGKLISAGIFIPMAQRFDLIKELDKLVVSETLAVIAAKGRGEQFAVNLSPDAVQDPAFVDWLCAELGRVPQHTGQIIFEIPEYGAVQNLDATRTLVDRVGALGARTSLDHFGRGFTSFGYLSTLKIHYLKIDGGYIRGIDQDRENQFFVQSLVRIAHGLDIEVIAESVETDKEWDTLVGLEVDGVQGYLIGKPELRT